MKFLKILLIFAAIFSTSFALNVSGSIGTPLGTVQAAFSSNTCEHIVQMVKNAANGFIASADFVRKVTVNTIGGFLGIDTRCCYTPEITAKAGSYMTKEAPKDAQIPTSFSAAQNWPECKEIIDLVPNNPMNESICWALTFAKTLTDKICIISDGQIKVEFSPLYIVECCKECYIMPDDRQEIPGGPKMRSTITYKSVWWGTTVIAWTYLLDHGIVSGGFTNQSEEKGCLPLTRTTKLETPRKKTLDQCGKGCSKTDGSRSPQPYKDELKKYHPKGKIFTITSKDVKQIQLEIMQNGPVQAGIQLYDDFYVYADGVYKHLSGNFNGNHTVVITGWGEGTEPYWEVTNVWGTSFGKAGKMKILRGLNTVGIESEIVAGRLDAGSVGASPTNVDGSSSTTDKGLSPTERSGSNPVTIPFHKMSILLTTTFLVFL